MNTSNPEEFLGYVVKSLVDNPDAVSITRTVDEMGVLLTLDLDPQDMGKVIGRKGATAKAIRTLLRIIGMKSNARVNMKINEPEGGNPSSTPRSETPAEAPAAEEVSDDTSVSSEMSAAIDELKADLE